MGSCTDQSRKSIHCMGRKRRIFAHLALKIMLTECSNGTITNGIAARKSYDGGAACQQCPHHSPLLIFGLLEAWTCESPAYCTGIRWAAFSLNTNQSPMSPDLHSHWVWSKSLLHHPLFPWQCSAGSVHWGLLWVEGGELAPTIKGKHSLPYIIWQE